MFKSVPYSCRRSGSTTGWPPTARCSDRSEVRATTTLAPLLFCHDLAAVLVGEVAVVCTGCSAWPWPIPTVVNVVVRVPSELCSDCGGGGEAPHWRVLESTSMSSVAAVGLPTATAAAAAVVVFVVVVVDEAVETGDEEDLMESSNVVQSIMALPIPPPP